MKRTIMMLAAALCSLFAWQGLADGDVAEVNGVGKSSLDSALSALAQDGGTLKVLTDGLHSSSLHTFSGSSNYTIDLNGFAVTSDDISTAGKAWLSYAGSGTLTIRNGKINITNAKLAAGNTGDASKYCCGIVEALNEGSAKATGTMYIEDITCGTDTRYPAIQVGAGRAYVRRCDFTATPRRYAAISACGGEVEVEETEVMVDTQASTSYSAALRANGQGKLTVKSGTYETKNSCRSLSIDSSGATVNIEGGTFKGTVYLDGRSGAQAKVNVFGGDFTDSSTSFNLQYSGTGSFLKLYGGTYRVKPSGNGVSLASFCEYDGESSPYTVKVKDQYAAVIGETPYEDIDTAIDALTAGQTLKVANDCTSDAFHSVSANATIDLNGKTVTVSTASAKDDLWITSTASSFVIKNGTVNFANSNAKGIIEGDAGNLTVEEVTCLTDTAYPAVIVNGGVGTVTGCRFEGSERKHSGVSVTGTGTATVIGTTITVPVLDDRDAGGPWRSAPIRVDSGRSVTISNCSLTVKHDGTSGRVGRVVQVLASGGNVTIDGGTYVGHPFMDGTGTSKSGSFTIKSGTFTNVESFEVRSGSSSANFTYVISGGTFDADPTAHVDTSKYEVDSSVADKWTVREKKVVVDAAATVTVGGTVTPYETLAAALAAVVEGCTVTLQKDATLTETVAKSVSWTLDLNGKELTADFATDSFAFAPATSGTTFTLVNSAPGSKSGFRAAGNCRGLGGPTAAGAAMAVEDIDCETESELSGECPMLFVSNGTLTATRCEMWSYAVAPAVKVSGGAATLTDCVIDSENMAISVTGGTLTIAGNVAEKQISGAPAVSCTETGSVVVEGGVFWATAGATFVRADSGTITVKGGTFDFDPSAYVPIGYVCDKSGNNWIVSKEVDGVAKIGNTAYQTLADALSHINDATDQTLTILKDCTMTTTVTLSKKNTTVNFNGKSVTGSSIVGYAFEVKAAGVKIIGDQTSRGSFTSTRGTCDGFVRCWTTGNDVTIADLDISNGGSKENMPTIYAREGGNAVVTRCDIGGVNRNETHLFATRGSTLTVSETTATVSAAHTSAGDDSVIGASYGGTVNVLSGTYQGYKYGVWTYSSGGYINISGGSISCKVSGGYALYADHANYTQSPSTLETEFNVSGDAVIDGPIYCGNCGWIGSLSRNYYTTINLTGGTYTHFSATKEADNSRLTVFGGLFDAEPAATILASGKVAVKVGDMWQVGAGYSVSVKKGEHVTGGTFTVGSTEYALGTTTSALAGMTVTITDVSYETGYGADGTYVKGYSATANAAIDWTVAAKQTAVYYTVDVTGGTGIAGGKFAVGTVTNDFGTQVANVVEGTPVEIVAVTYTLGYQPAGEIVKGFSTNVTDNLALVVAAAAVSTDPAVDPVIPKDATAAEMGITNTVFQAAETSEIKQLVKWEAVNKKDGADINAASFVEKTVGGETELVPAEGDLQSEAYLLDCAPTTEAIAEAKDDFTAEISFDADGNPVVNIRGEEADAETYGNGTLIKLGAAELVSPSWSKDLDGAKFFKFELVK